MPRRHCATWCSCGLGPSLPLIHNLQPALLQAHHAASSALSEASVSHERLNDPDLDLDQTRALLANRSLADSGVKEGYAIEGEEAEVWLRLDNGTRVGGQCITTDTMLALLDYFGVPRGHVASRGMMLKSEVVSLLREVTCPWDDGGPFRGEKGGLFDPTPWYTKLGWRSPRHPIPPIHDDGEYEVDIEAEEGKGGKRCTGYDGWGDGRDLVIDGCGAVGATMAELGIREIMTPTDVK